MSLQKQIDLSFEFFPPKTVASMQNLLAAAQQLAVAKPSFYSVTFGAGGSTRQGTLETVAQLQQQTATPITPHLSCLGLSRAELGVILQQYQALGVNSVVALRGDLPADSKAEGDVECAYHLVELIRQQCAADFNIKVAAYPEFHPQAHNAEADLNNLKRKYEAGANSAITQYFFNPDAYFYFLEACQRQHIDMPIIPGIMPIMQLSKLARFSTMCGAEIPRWLYKRLEAYGDDLAACQAFGVEVVTTMCEKLLAGGAPGMHFYTLNQAELSLQVVKGLALRPFKSVLSAETVEA